MSRHKIIIALVLVLTYTQAFSQSQNQDRNVKIKVPIEWIEKLRQYDYKHSNLTILKEFEEFIKPDSLVGSKESEHEDGGILNPMSVNLDNEQTEELIGLFGWSESNPTLAVFKLIDNSWYLIYTEPFYSFYYEPELQVANNFSANKTFYIRWLYERGSGVYCDAYHFYKLIDNKVVPCLQLINSAHIFGWGLYLNQTVDMKFKFNCATADELWVSYNYNFFPGAVFENDVPWKGHEEISFAKSDDGIEFSWDKKACKYRPSFNNREDGLTADKIACFGAFGNDTLFVRAFDHEIKQILKEGRKDQQKFLKKYLDIVKKKGKAVSPTGVIEEKGQIGGHKFYGTKKKK